MRGPRNINIKTNKGFRVQIAFSGWKKLDNTFTRLRKGGRAASQKFLEEEGRKFIIEAKGRVPKDTERLMDSHRVLTFGNTGKNDLKIAIVAGGKIVRGRFVNYAAAVHEGSKAHDGIPRMPARPWLKQTLDAREGKMMKRMKKFMKAELKKQGIRLR